MPSVEAGRRRRSTIRCRGRCSSTSTRSRPLEKPEVKQFVEFYLKNAKQLVGRSELPAASGQALTRWPRSASSKLKTGTGFGGVPEIGLPVEEILKREPKN